ncbi:MAG TPA: tRNA pseudouridine(55) synthase TruB [Firmicutes bacterium]|nr:tRNA pseudouridine(55) synthase TruB [Candidatus Fermentithermobacillaceae bacterium]
MDGFLNVFKPSGITSHDLVLLVRRVFGEDRTGHLGTLDPLAVGVLPMALGAYRRLSEYFLAHDKRYLAEFRFGLVSDTDDLDGNVSETGLAGSLSEKDVLSRLPDFTGVILQEPPAYSALKVKGRRLYDLAREGAEVPVKPRRVAVYELRLVGWKPGRTPSGLFSMRVGRGTYVRSLASGLGDALGCGAVVSYLLRVSSGTFRLKDSVTPQELLRAKTAKDKRALLVDPLLALPDFLRFQIKPSTLKKIDNGVELRPGDFLEAARVASLVSASLKEEPREAPKEKGGSKEDRRMFLAYDRDALGSPRVLAVLYPEEGKLKYDKVITRESDLVASHRTD